MTTEDTETGVAAESSATDDLRTQVAAFPWPVGVLAGAGAFLAGYALVAVYALASGASIPGGPADVASILGFAFYNAHGVLVVADTGPNVVTPSVDYLATAARRPLVYRAIPVVVLAVTGGAFTYRQGHERPDGVAVVATGAAVTLGYLAVALVGTFVFTTTQTADAVTVVYHPGRVGTLLWLSAYPFALGVVSGIVVQAVTARE